jgi:hypothetical protein
MIFVMMLAMQHNEPECPNWVVAMMAGDATTRWEMTAFSMFSPNKVFNQEINGWYCSL